jgi:aldose sugar dehydrogenase
MKNKPLLSILLLTILFACGKSDPPATPVELQATTLVENLIVPWEILWGPDNKIWMTERTGKISRVDTGTGAITPLLTVSEVVHQGEAGMLGMVLHPNFNTTPQVFVAYNYNNGGNLREKIVRYTYNGTTLINPLIIQDNIAASNIHNGCRLAIGPDMKLYISTGDASVPSNSQNSSSLNGKILRLNLDGTIPADNPSAGSPIWTKGHRNPQGLVFVNDRLYSAEHGPDTDDEVNIIEKGRNYGWPDVPGFCDGSETAFCNANNVKEPIKAWTPTLAVSGIDYYNHDLIPQWKNSILVATLKNQRIYQLKLNGDGSAVTEINEYLTNTYGRLRDFCISPDGKVFVSTSNGGNDKIIKINKK